MAGDVRMRTPLHRACSGCCADVAKVRDGKRHPEHQNLLFATATPIEVHGTLAAVGEVPMPQEANNRKCSTTNYRAVFILGGLGEGGLVQFLAHVLKPRQSANSLGGDSSVVTPTVEALRKWHVGFGHKAERCSLIRANTSRFSLYVHRPCFFLCMRMLCRDVSLRVSSCYRWSFHRTILDHETGDLSGVYHATIPSKSTVPRRFQPRPLVFAYGKLHTSAGGFGPHCSVLLHTGFSGLERQILLEHGADPNALDRTRRTPLHRAARWGSPACALLLLDAGADIEVLCALSNTSCREDTYTVQRALSSR